MRTKNLNLAPWHRFSVFERLADVAMTDRSWNQEYVVPGFFAAVSIVVHLFVNAFAGYGFFRDELYYIISTDHVAAGYVDHPPLSIWILAVIRALFGDTLFVVRLLPALLSGTMIFTTGLMVTELGGGRFAQLTACLASLASLVYLAMHAFYSMNAIDIQIWSLIMLLFLRMVKLESDKLSPGPDLRHWALLGVLLGLGLLNKVGVLWLGFGLATALMVTPLRRHLRQAGPWITAGLAVMFFLPYIIWNAQHDWAHLEFIRNASSGKYSGLSVMDFIVGQFMVNNPVTAPLWIAGLVYFARRSESVWKAPAAVYLAAFLVLALNGTSKAEYLSPAYTMLFAAGGIQLEELHSRYAHILARRIYPVILASGLILAPATLPILPVQDYIAYADALGIQPSTAESKDLAELPQFYADMFGWRELAANVADVYHTLPDSERASCIIYASNYGEASAVTLFGEASGLPPAISGHNSYFLWGPGTDEAAVAIIIGGRDHSHTFESVELRTVHRASYVMPYENNLPIYVCRGWKMPLGEVWKGTKHYD